MSYKIIQPIKAQFALQTKLFNTELESISEEKSIISIGNTHNSIKWLAGHLLNTRYVVISILTKTPLDTDFAKLFGKGSTGKVDETYPSLEEIKFRWNESAKDLNDILESKTNEELLVKPPFQTSIPDETLLGFIAYMSYHEAFHLGQLSILKRFDN